MIIYLRQSGGEKRGPLELKPIGPKEHDSPTVDRLCVACYRVFRPGDFTTLIPLGPGDDPAEQEDARAGGFYSGVAIEVHWHCATGKAHP